MQRNEIAGVILAAGEASRFRKASGDDGPQTKLVAQYQGKALVRHVAEAALDAGLAPVAVVTGYAHEAVCEALDGLALTQVHNGNFASGMASSLQAGLKQLPPGVKGAVILLGDMPLVSAALILQLVRAFEAHPGAAAVLPVYKGERGNPVLLSAALFPDLQKLTGDAGARQILRGRDADIIEVAVDEPAARLDVDTPDALRDIARS